MYPPLAGETLSNAVLAYTTYGRLNEAGDNVVVLPTFYTGTHVRKKGFFGRDVPSTPSAISWCRSTCSATVLKAFARVYIGWAYSQTFFRDGLYRSLGHDTIEDLLVDWELAARRHQREPALRRRLSGCAARDLRTRHSDPVHPGFLDAAIRDVLA
ncbi:hypothetical protein ACQI4F_14995 [Mycolicibacterium vaccae]|uniref:hypothetical protein n=1 Tax=Mycolicibacterium vaccae TaxID=1810 RepID=UPI003CE7A987